MNTSTQASATPNLASVQTSRHGSTLGRISLFLMIPGGLLAAAWVTAGRSLLGAGGDFVPVFALSLGPALALVYLTAAFFSFKEVKLQKTGVGAGLPLVTALVQASGWVLAFLFGLLVPDRIDGVTVSAAASIFGSDVVGLSAGFGNTAGILTFAFAVAVLLMSISTWRTSKEAARGINADVREQLEREESIYDFLD
ncbi:MAG: hypothetical protein Q3965_04265 [Rothia sp. (in: high G+C Gram-positive bacteria)]|nr:hypothetical protein [Rothia sp. (in: high G+C Gram-positive bacteria)]